jgi:ABC-type microcin C transport system duplicated ATPase subunit YejF
MSDPTDAHAAAEMQFIFQDPFSSLNPRMTVGALIEEPMRGPWHRHARGAPRAGGAASDPRRPDGRAHADRYPHEFSGGQRQRIGIARALVTGRRS